MSILYNPKEDETFSVLEQCTFQHEWNQVEGELVQQRTGITELGRKGIATSPAHDRYTHLFKIYMLLNLSRTEHRYGVEAADMLRDYAQKYPSSIRNVPKKLASQLEIAVEKVA